MFKDKNTLIGFVVIFGILIAFSIFNSPSKDEIEEQKRKEDSLKQTQQVQNPVVDTATQVPVVTVDSSEIKVPQTDINVVSTDTNFSETALTVFSVDESLKEEVVYIENDLLKIGISTMGGKIAELELKEYKKFDHSPLYLFNRSFSTFGLNFFSANKPVQTSNLYFEPILSEEGKDSDTTSPMSLGMRLYPYKPDSLHPADSWIEFKYALTNESYVIDFVIDFHKMDGYIDKSASFIGFDMAADMYQQEKSLDNEKNVTTVYYSLADTEVDYLSERKDDKESLQTKLRWVSFKQQFFSFSMISKDGFLTADMETYDDETKSDSSYLKTLKASVTFPLDSAGSYSIPLMLYAGPNHYKTLRALDLDLERQIPLGWSFFLMQWINRFAVIPVFNFLEGFNMNYGIIILILTLLLKIVLFPIAYKTYLSSARMKVLKPEIEEINKKFPKKEEAMKKQQATMELYKKAGVNPMAGCLPMLLQFPILIAMFRFFPASIELRQEAFLWAEDLSAYDSILELGFNIPFYGSHVSLFTLLMTISTIIYTRVNSQMMGQSSTMPGMKTMMYLMPVMFLGFFNSYSSALSYYYLLANLITFAQMAVFNKLVNVDKIHARIQENKKKPVKKSGFQRRLEEMARQQKARKK